MKPRLTIAVKNEQYRFALAYRYQILEDQKAIIQLDKISIISGYY